MLRENDGAFVPVPTPSRKRVVRVLPRCLPGASGAADGGQQLDADGLVEPYLFGKSGLDARVCVSIDANAS
jgi:hypothetical protein